jgi:DNA-binding response OmpR family regulator
VTILLIEDNAQLAEFISYSLPEAEVLIAGTLATALKILSAYRVNLMLIDLNLPDSRGLATLAALKSYAYPKIVISASDSKTISGMTGITDYIDKANGVTDIVDRIRFNIGKISKRTERFSPSVFEEIKACLQADRQLVAV